MTEYSGYKIEHMGTFNLFKIKNKGQGPAPKVLSGMYTTMEQAKQSIDGYLAKTKKGITNGASKGGSQG